jgi:hypothetical protein
MIYRGVSYDLVRSTDVHVCWRWIFIVNNCRKSGQTKISRRAAEIQVQSTIDKALACKEVAPSRHAHAKRAA